MVMEQGAPNRKVAIDAGAAIKLQRLDRFGGELFTTSGVLREVRDENARMLLQTLPQEIRVREPLAQDILYTKQFAKATGDLGFLSQNDIELIALTVGLHREEGGSLRERPAILQTGEGSCGFDWAPANAKAKTTDTPQCNASVVASTEPPANSADAALSHFTNAAHRTTVSGVLAEVEATEAPQEESGAAEAIEIAHESGAVAAAAEELSPAEESDAAHESGMAPAVAREPSAAEKSEAALEPGTTDSVAQELAAAEGTEAAHEAAGTEVTDAVTSTAEADAQVSDDEDGSSAGEWVTEENMHRFGLGIKPASELKATCATADYSVQNVLLQMGITPLTFDGFAVRSVKLWGLVCRACFHFTRDSQKVFCPKCGNDTVVRVPIIVDQDGQAKMLNNGRRMKLKGSVYSMPKPEGGRGWKPIYAEDEILMGGRDRQLRRAQKMQDKDRQMRDPFNEDNAARAWYQRSGTSARGPNQMPRMKAGLGRVNPNANNFKGHRSKKR